MVPFVDIFNYSTTSKCSHMFSERTNQFTVIRDKSQQFESGDEICLNYGLIPNSKLLMLYGFSLLDNTHCSIDVYISIDHIMSEISNTTNSTNTKGTANTTNTNNNIITTTMSVNTIKMEAMNRLGISNFDEPFTIYENVFPTKLMYFLRIQHYGENNDNNKDNNKKEESDDNYTVEKLIEISQNASPNATERKACRVFINTLEGMCWYLYIVV